MTASSGNASQMGAKKTQVKLKKPRTKPTHPRTADMVNAAIKSLKERSGSSLQAIKKYVTSVYKIDAEKQAPFIKRYLKTAVANGGLVQTKGKGAAGSFKLSTGKSDVPKTIIKKKPAGSSKVGALKKSPTVKKVNSTPKKSAVAKKAIVKKSPKKPIAEKRKVTKGPAAKPPKAKTSLKVKPQVAKVKAIPKKQKVKAITPKITAMKSSRRRK